MHITQKQNPVSVIAAGTILLFVGCQTLGAAILTGFKSEGTAFFWGSVMLSSGTNYTLFQL